MMFLDVGGPMITLKYKGIVYRFESHEYMGALQLRVDGEPYNRQPGLRSPFWDMYTEYRQGLRRLEQEKADE